MSVKRPKRVGLFADEGGGRVRPGPAEYEWAVWLAGPDEISPQPGLAAALIAAAEYNAVAADLDDGDPLNPPLRAVVLHHGYAWSRHSQHVRGAQCGLRCPDCPPELAA